MKLVRTVLIGLVFALVLSFVQSGFSAYSVGVKSGDWMKYNVTLSWTGTQPDASDFGELGEAEYMKGEILTVDGTSVTAKMSMHMKNGTDVQQTLVGDIAAGTGNLTIFIIPSGLSKGDSFTGAMFGEDSASLIITDTVSKTYCGSSRTVNVYSLTAPAMSGFSASMAGYWDQATGVLVDLSMQMSMTMTGQSPQSMDMKVLATETNMWSSGLFGGFNFSSDPMMNILIPVVCIGLVATGIALIAWVLVRSHRPIAAMPQPVPTPPTEPAPPTATQ